MASVKAVPCEHISVQPTAVSYAHPHQMRRPSLVAKVLDAYTLPQSSSRGGEGFPRQRLTNAPSVLV